MCRSAFSQLTIKPVTSPDNHSLVKPHLTEHTVIEDVDKDSKWGEDDAHGEDADANINQSTLFTKKVWIYSDLSHNFDYMVMNGMSDQNIKTPLTFSCGDEPEDLNNKNIQDGCRPSNKDSDLNRFKFLLEACTVVGGLNRGLISHWTFCSNK